MTEYNQQVTEKKTTFGKVLGAIILFVVIGIGITGFIIDAEGRLNYFTGLCIVLSVVWGAKAHKNHVASSGQIMPVVQDNSNISGK